MVGRSQNYNKQLGGVNFYTDISNYSRGNLIFYLSEVLDVNMKPNMLYL